MSASTPAPEAEPKTLSRDEARAKIFGAKASATPMTLFGVPVDLREPPISEVMDSQVEEDRKRGSMMMLVRYVYLRDSEQPLFEEADIETLLTLPFGKDFRDINLAIQKMLGVIPSGDDKSQASAQPA